MVARSSKNMESLSDLSYTWMLFLIFTLPLGTEFASHSTRKINAIKYSLLPFLASSPNTKSKFLTCFPVARMIGMRKRKHARVPIRGWKEYLWEGAKVKWPSLSGVEELRALEKLPGQKKQWVDQSPGKQQRVKGVAPTCGCTVAATHWGHWQETNNAQEALWRPWYLRMNMCLSWWEEAECTWGVPSVSLSALARADRNHSASLRLCFLIC